MTRRLTAEELVDEIYERAACGHDAVPGSVQHHVGEALSNVAVIVRDNLVPRWQAEPDAETHATCPWWWVENLGDDSPPQKLRNYRPMKMNPEDSTFSVSLNEPLRWDIWTVAGWIPLVGRVCHISERPRS